MKIENIKYQLPKAKKLLVFPNTKRFIVLDRFNKVLFVSFTFKYFRLHCSHLRKADSRNESRTKELISFDNISFYNQVNSQQQINKGYKFIDKKSNYSSLGDTRFKIGVDFFKSDMNKTLLSTDGKYKQVIIK